MGPAELFADQITGYLRDKSSVIICYDDNQNKANELFEFCINNTSEIVKNKVMFILPLVKGLTIEIINTLRNINFIILPIPMEAYYDIKGVPSNIKNEEDLNIFISKYSTHSKEMIGVILRKIEKSNIENLNGIYMYDIESNNNKIIYHFKEKVKSIKDINLVSADTLIFDIEFTNNNLTFIKDGIKATFSPQQTAILILDLLQNNFINNLGTYSLFFQNLGLGIPTTRQSIYTQRTEINKLLGQLGSINSIRSDFELFLKSGCRNNQFGIIQFRINSNTRISLTNKLVSLNLAN